MERAVDNVQAMVPALLFLCAGVPLAALLDRLGFFDAVALVMERRGERVSVGALWWLAAVTTVVLNLDTTVVLLTPLYIRLARRNGADPLPVAIVPLLLASFASSVLPVSNLTTLIATDRYGLSVADVFGHLAPVSAAACIAGWLAYRRRHPRWLVAAPTGEPDRRALRIGAVVVGFVLAGFVVGGRWHLEPWMVAFGADLVLMVVTRTVPWREVPLVTAAGVAGVGALVAVALPVEALTSLLATSSPSALAAVMAGGSGAANVVNNLPALLVALDRSPAMTPGMWAWLAGVNTGAVLLPLGALANLLWLRIVRDEAVDVDVRRYVRTVGPIALPALAAALIVLAATSRTWS